MDLDLFYFYAYVMDGKRKFGGIQEVRGRLVNGHALVLNADANWNRENLQTKEDYLENYMAKTYIACKHRFAAKIILKHGEKVKK